MPRETAKKATATKRAPARKPAAKKTTAKTERKPYAFDAKVYLDPDPGGIKTDAGGRPMTDKGGRPLTKD